VVANRYLLLLILNVTVLGLRTLLLAGIYLVIELKHLTEGHRTLFVAGRYLIDEIKYKYSRVVQDLISAK
jgi:hypothetical protein